MPGVKIEVKRYMTVNEVAKLIGVHPRTVRRWHESGETCLQAWHPTHRLGIKGLRFTGESVEIFMRLGQIAPDDCDDADEFQPERRAGK